MLRPISPSDAQRVARTFMPLVGLAAVLGGSVFWARRVGLLDPETYWGPYTALVRAAEGRRGDFDAYFEILRFGSSLHQLDGALWLTKLAKEAVWLALVLLALSQVGRVRLPRAFTAIYLGLFALSGGSAISALLHGRWIDVLAGGRVFGSWVLGASGTAIVSKGVLHVLAVVCAWTLVVQGLLAPFEVWNGLTMYSMELFGTGIARIVGTFNLPISLGTFVVVTWAVALCWGSFSRRTMAWLTALVLALLVLNASATAWVSFGAAAVVRWRGRLGERGRVTLLLSVMPIGILLWLGLPTLTGRPDIHDSLWGRIQPVHEYAVDHLSPTEIAFGRSFGLGTNASWTMTHSAEALQRQVVPDRPVGDSMPATLLWQVGLIGLVLAYGACGLALQRDASAQPIGVALLVASLAVNITELFPVNLILGLWLAHAAAEREVPG